MMPQYSYDGTCSIGEDTTLFGFKHILFRRKGLVAAYNLTTPSPLL